MKNVTEQKLSLARNRSGAIKRRENNESKGENERTKNILKNLQEILKSVIKHKVLSDFNKPLPFSF